MPANIANATLRGGQIVVPKSFTKVEEMLQMFDDDQADALDQLARSTATLVVGAVDRTNARRLQQMVYARDPEARSLAAPRIRSGRRSGPEM